MGIRRLMARRRVDFPDPEGPMMEARVRRLDNLLIPAQILKSVPYVPPGVLSPLKLVDDFVQFNNIFIVAHIALNEAGSRHFDDVGKILLIVVGG